MPYTYTEQDILYLLETHDFAVKRAIKTLNDKSAFLAPDRNFGESLATQLQFGRNLTPPQMKTGRRLVKKYSRYLMTLANTENVRVPVPQ
jgi:hypothetical protein